VIAAHENGWYATGRRPCGCERGSAVTIGQTSLARRLEAQAQEPTLGALLGRRDIGVLGSAEELAVPLKQMIREAGWEHILLGEIVGDGAPWIWTMADAHVPGMRQTLDD
jgi:hypothetical protein